MKFARYRSGEQISYGIVEGDTVRDISGPPWEGYQATGATHRLSDVKLLVPTEPKNILTTGINSRSHAISEQNKPNNPRVWETMAEPMVSIRNITSAIGHGEDIIRPDGAETLREEVELVVVMGKKCKKVPMSEIYDYVFGYTIGNDLTVKNWEYTREAWRAKCCDTLHPIGPWIETDLNPGNVMTLGRVNGVETQCESTAGQRFSVAHLISHIARHITLYPGDLIFMGTWGDPADCKVGDVVEIEIEGIGVLRNQVIGED